MMLTWLSVLIAAALSIHGLIHLIGFVAYWPLKEVPELAYKTAFLGGQLELGANGTRIYSVLWLLAAIGFVVAGIALVANWTWGRPLLVIVALLSLAITVLDWGAAFRGTLIDAVILAVVFLGPTLAGMFSQASN